MFKSALGSRQGSFGGTTQITVENQIQLNAFPPIMLKLQFCFLLYSICLLDGLKQEDVETLSRLNIKLEVGQLNLGKHK